MNAVDMEKVERMIDADMARTRLQEAMLEAGVTESLSILATLMAQDDGVHCEGLTKVGEIGVISMLTRMISATLARIAFKDIAWECTKRGLVFRAGPEGAGREVRLINWG